MWPWCCEFIPYLWMRCRHRRGIFDEAFYYGGDAPRRGGVTRCARCVRYIARIGLPSGKMTLVMRQIVLAFFDFVLMSRRTQLAPNKRYDRAYFDRWYRATRTRIDTAQSLARKVHLAVSVA